MKNARSIAELNSQKRDVYMRCSRFFQLDVSFVQINYEKYVQTETFALGSSIGDQLSLITGFRCIAADHLTFVQDFDSDMFMEKAFVVCKNVKQYV